LWVENGLNAELERRGEPDHIVVGISFLHKRTPVQLRDDLQRLEKNKSLQKVLSSQQLRMLRAWIDREWAAVSAIALQTRSRANTVHGIDAESNAAIARCRPAISGDAMTDQTSVGAIISQRRSRVKTASTTDTETKSSTTQAEADRRSLEEIERETPELDTESMDWVASRKENEKKLGYPTSTLAKYRLESLGGRQLSEYFGIDKDNRRWRRDENKTPNSTVYYLANDIEKYRKKA
jgi:hypothetical protein